MLTRVGFAELAERRPTHPTKSRMHLMVMRISMVG